MTSAPAAAATRASSASTTLTSKRIARIIVVGWSRYNGVRRVAGGPGRTVAAGGRRVERELFAALPTGPALAGGATGDDVEMVEVPAGAFTMGSADADADADEQPVARILVGTFRIDRVEVANRRYLRCVEAGQCYAAERERSDPARPGRAARDDPELAQAMPIVAGRASDCPPRPSGRRPPGARTDAGIPWGDTFAADRANAGRTLGLGPVGPTPDAARRPTACSTWQGASGSGRRRSTARIRTMLMTGATTRRLGARESTVAAAGTTDRGTFALPTGRRPTTGTGGFRIWASAALDEAEASVRRDRGIRSAPCRGRALSVALVLAGLALGVAARAESLDALMRDFGLGPLSGEPSSISLPDLGGQPVTLDGQRGRVVLLYFWATWCPYCTKEMPTSLQALHTEFRDQGLVILAINLGEPRARAAGWVRDQGLTFTVLLDESGRRPPPTGCGPRRRRSWSTAGGSSWDAPWDLASGTPRGAGSSRHCSPRGRSRGRRPTPTPGDTIHLGTESEQAVAAGSERRSARPYSSRMDRRRSTAARLIGRARRQRAGGCT